jgi:hypothetical protein
VLALSACGGGGAPGPTPAPTTSASSQPVQDDGTDARSSLVARATLAQDKSFAAQYTFDGSDGRQHNVLASVGADGTWRVDVSDAVLGDTTDVSIVSTAAGVYQCTVASASNPVTPACVKVAAKNKRVPAAYSPEVERLFRQWLPVFTDRQSALSVTEVQPLEGAQGDCFSIDGISASLKAPVDIGIYCYADDGVLTAARVDFGVLKLVSQVPGPATIGLPGPESPSQPMSTDAPPPVPEPSDAPSPA